MNLKLVYGALGVLCIVYYLIIGAWSRFGLSLSILWPILGGLLLVSAALVGRVPTGLSYVWRGVLILWLVGTLILEGFVISGMNARTPQNLDYIIVLGAKVDGDQPSPALRRRLNAAIEYLNENPDTKVVVSGGKGDDEHLSEAACMQRELIAAGIAPERIFMEDQSTSTAENMAFSKKWIDPDDSVGLVTNNFHVFRSVKIAEKAGYTNVSGLAAEYTGPTLPHYMVREAICLIVEFVRGTI